MTLSAPRTLRLPLVVVFAALLAAAGCAKAAPGGGGGQTTPSSTTSGIGSTGGTPVSTPSPSSNYHVTYGWALPSQKATVVHTVNPPITSPPGLPLPYLVGTYTGDHSTETPGYARISFYFRGGFPQYSLQYVAALLSQGSGKPISLEGNAVLDIEFVEAQAHDNAGKSTIKDVANQHIGFHNLRSYASGGDFEGHLSYGLGIQVAANSDQRLPIRVGELSKSDGAGGTLYVVAFDVQNG